MQRVSVRTLTLMLLLLASVLAHQFVMAVPSAKADAVWLATSDPNDPNEGPVPECGYSAALRTWLDDDPNEPSEPPPEMLRLSQGRMLLGDDPNEPSEPGPEMLRLSQGRMLLGDDPNEPSEPAPERA